MKSPYLTMAEIVRIYRVHEATGRRWAREDAWRRTGTRPVRYSLADAQQSYETRHAPKPRPACLNILDRNASLRRI